MNLAEAFAQGAHCGHLEGKGRADQYIIQEEVDLSYQAADNQDFTLEQANLKQFWSKGYQAGYRLAAEGESLPSDPVLYVMAAM